MTDKPLIISSFLVALLLSILPLPIWAVWLKPLWVVLVLVYWVNQAPYQIGLFVAWILGFCLDILNGTLLGEHALALTLVAFVTAKLYRRLRLTPLPHQILHVLIYLLLYQLVLFTIQALIGSPIREWRFWLAPFISVLLWPWLTMLLSKCQRRYPVKTA